MPKGKSAARMQYLTWAVSESRRKLKFRAVEYKGGKCIKCRYVRCIAVLQFHHRDPKKKDFAISGIHMAWARLKIELDKTDLLCANCHIELHAEQSERDRVLQEKTVRAFVPARIRAECGSASKYAAGCRCDPCRAAHAARCRKYR